jgi:hypothetical protein
MSTNTVEAGRRTPLRCGSASRHRPAVRGVTAAALAAGLLLAAGPGQAQAARTPGWRVIKTIGPDAGATGVNGFLAAGAKVAWSTWSTCNPCGGSKPVETFLVQRWNGKSWRTVPMPKALEAKESEFAVGLAASSSTNAWLFNWFQDSTKALRWTGRSWHVVTIPSWVVRGNLSGDVSLAAYAFAPSSAWVFSFGVDSFTKPETFAARYADGKWTKSGLPGVPVDADAVAANDIWVLGVTAKSALGSHQVQILMHWNGRRWSTVTVVPGVAKLPAGTTEAVVDLAANSADNVWLQRDLATTSSVYTMDLLHWTGKKWQRVAIKYAKSFIDDMTTDGHGGLWMIANGPAPKYAWYFYHYGSGHWSRVGIPSARGTTLQGASRLVNVPGTTTMLAAGQVELPHRAEGLLGTIWQDGG